MPLNSFFVSSRYLNWLARCKSWKLSIVFNAAQKLWTSPQPTDLYIFLEMLPSSKNRARFSRNRVRHFGISRRKCEREDRVRDKDEDDKMVKNYHFLYTTISREPEVVSGWTKNCFKGEGSALLTIAHSSTGSCYLRSYGGSNFF